VIKLRGPCRVQTLKVYVSFVCGPFGDHVYDARCETILSPEVLLPMEGVHELEPGESLNPILGVRNVGTMPVSFPATCRITCGGTLIYDQEMWAMELMSGEPTDLVFPDWFPEEGAYAIAFQTGLAGDENPGNDACAPVKFEVVFDSDGDGMPDWWEEQYSCLDPQFHDDDQDPDGDGLTTWQEFLGPDGVQYTGDETDPCD